MEARTGPNVAGMIGRHHEPIRPDWICDTDGEEWPCVPARERMLTTWTVVGRGLTMSAYFEQAAADQPAAPAGLLHRRFLGWIRDVP
jgi:hypothetical protein